MDIRDKIDILLETMDKSIKIYSIDFTFESSELSIYQSFDENIKQLGTIIFDEITSNRFLKSYKTTREIYDSLNSNCKDFKVPFKIIIINFTDKEIKFIGITDEKFKNLLIRLIH